MKLTEDHEKQTLPGSKAAFRLLGSDGDFPLLPFCPFSSLQPLVDIILVFAQGFS